jgi:hypothetical protein
VIEFKKILAAASRQKKLGPAGSYFLSQNEGFSFEDTCIPSNSTEVSSRDLS